MSALAGTAIQRAASNAGCASAVLAATSSTAPVQRRRIE
jgi:hypothetical protein